MEQSCNLRHLCIASCCLLMLVGGCAGLGSSECSPEVLNLLDSAEEDPLGGRLVYTGATNYSLGTISTYMVFFEGSEACFGPKAAGAEVSFASLANLPSADLVSVQPPESCKADATGPECFSPYDVLHLPFPAEEVGDFSPFQGVQIDWEPMGHPPMGVYTAPLLNFQFLLVTFESLQNITTGPCLCIAKCGGLSPQAFTATNEPLPHACFPGSGFANIGSATPLLGNHYVNMDSPELKAMLAGGDGMPLWNVTWQWGGFDGQITYLQLIAKRDYLMSRPSMCMEIPGVPREFAIPGFRPHTYCILSTEEGVRAELRDFSWYSAGCAGDTGFAPASYARVPPGGPPIPEECVLPKIM